MVVFRSFPFLPFLSLFSKLYLPSSSSFHLFIFASLHPSMDPSVTLSVLLINLLSPTAAIDPSIRTHTHPSTCFPSIDVTLTSIRSFIRLFVSSFFLRFNSYTVQPFFLSLFVFFATNLFRGHIQISQSSTMEKLDDTLTLKQTPHFM